MPMIDANEQKKRRRSVCRIEVNVGFIRLTERFEDVDWIDEVNEEEGSVCRIK